MRLDVYVHDVGSITIEKAELPYCKLELSRLLGVLATAPPGNRPDFLKQLIRIILQANKIQGAAQDPELGDLLTRAERSQRPLYSSCGKLSA